MQFVNKTKKLCDGAAVTVKTRLRRGSLRSGNLEIVGCGLEEEIYKTRPFIHAAFHLASQKQICWTEFYLNVKSEPSRQEFGS